MMMESSPNLTDATKTANKNTSNMLQGVAYLIRRNNERILQGEGLSLSANRIYSMVIKLSAGKIIVVNSTKVDKAKLPDLNSAIVLEINVLLMTCP
jgi:S-adenosylmethionine:tRNA-ribosyltransferase-isomerase (queuine synthetase)